MPNSSAHAHGSFSPSGGADHRATSRPRSCPLTIATTLDASPAALYVALHGALVFLAMLATLAGVLSVARGALDAREVAPQHAVVAETIGV